MEAIVNEKLVSPPTSTAFIPQSVNSQLAMYCHPSSRWLPFLYNSLVLHPQQQQQHLLNYQMADSSSSTSIQQHLVNVNHWCNYVPTASVLNPQQTIAASKTSSTTTGSTSAAGYSVAQLLGRSPHNSSSDHSGGHLFLLIITLTFYSSWRTISISVQMNESFVDND